MPSYTLPLDGNSRPASGGYTPAIGVITLQTGTPTTDGLGVTSAPLNVVLVPDSGTYQEQSALSAGYQGAYLVPMTDVSAFKWLSLHITGDYNGTLAFQVSNNGQDWDNYPMAQQNTPGLLVSSVMNQTGVFGGPVLARYFQVQMVNYVSGIATGTLEQYVVPPMLPVPISPTGIKVDGSGVTQPVVGVFTIDTRNQAPIPISQTQVGLVGASVPLSAALLGASDGVSLRALSVDGSGNLNVNVAPGSAGNTNTGALLNAIAITSGLQSADQTNATGQGAKIALNMTSVGTGSVTLIVEGKDTASGQYYPILQGLPVTTNGVSVYTVYPGVPVGQNVAIANELVLPTTWRVRTLANNSNPTSYTVGASVFGSLTSGGGGGTSSSFSATFPGVGTAIGASDGTNMKALLVDGSGYLKVNVVAGGGAGGTSSSFSSAFPSTGTAIGASDGTNMKALQVDGSGYLKVNMVAGGGSGGTALADDTPFTAGTTSLTPSGGVYNDAITSATTGHADAVRITAKRAFHTNLRDSSGNELLGSKTSANSVPIVIASDQGAVTISGTVTANMGTTNGLALDTSVNGLLLSQGSTTSGQKGPLILGAVTTNAPSYTIAQSSPLSLDPSGLLRASLKDTPSNTNNLNVNLAASSVTQSVSGTVTANAGTGPFPVAGIVASGASNANNPVKVGGVFNSTQPTVTTGQIVDAQMTARGASIVATGVDAFAVNASQVGTWNVNTISGTVSLPTGAATSAKQPALGTAGSASSDVLTVQGISSMTALKVDGSGVTQPISGTVTANAGSGTFTIQSNASVNVSQVAGSSVATAATGIMKVGLTDASGNALNSTSNALNISQQATGSASTILQNAQTGNANGTSLTVLGMATVSFTVTASGFTGTVNFEGTEDTSNWSSLLCTLAGGTTTATSATSAGQYSASCAGLQSVRARTSGVSAGNVTVTAHAVPVSGGGGGGGGSGSNASVSATASSVPSSASYIGGNKAGNLVGVSLDGSGNLNVNVAAGGGSGGTSSSFGSALPATGTAVGFTDGTNMQVGKAFDADTGAGTEYVIGAILRKSASGGSVEVGTSSNPLRTDPTGTTTQPVSGTVSITANSAVNVAQVAGTTTDTNSGNKSAGTQRVVLATDQPQLTNALKVDGSAVTQPVSGTITANAGTGTFTNQQSNITTDYDTSAGTQTMTMFGLALPASGGSVAGGTATNPVQVSLANTAANSTAVKVDGSAVTQPVSGTVSITSNSAINVAQVGGTTTDTNSGNKSAGTLRVVLATDQPALTNKLLVTPDSVALPANQSVNVSQINGVTTTMGNGISGTGVQRVTLASDSTGQVTLATGANTIGALTANQSMNVAQVAGATTSTAASGVQKVGVVGNSGATVDSTTGAGTAPTNAVVTGAIYNSSAPAPTSGQAMALQADQAGNHRIFPGIALAALSAWNSSTALNATQTIFTNSGAEAVLVQLTQTTTLSAGAITYEVSYDGSTWLTMPASSVLDPTSATFAQISIPYTVQASTNKYFLLNCNGAQGLRIKLSTQITGSGTVTPNYALLPFSPADTVIALSPTASNFNVTASAGTNLNTSTLALESGGNLATLAGGVTSSKYQANMAQLAGTTTDTNSGNKSAGTLRVVMATDQPALTNAQPANITQVAGNAVAVGNNAVPVLNSAATGYVSAFGSNAAALTSSTDYSFKWGAGGTTQVNHVMIQNNTTSNMNFDLDVAATAGSPILAPGQTLFFDVQTTATHLFQAGTPNVNGSSAGNIVVRGWL